VFRTRWVVPLPAVLLAMSLGIAGGDAVAAPAPAPAPRAATAVTAAAADAPCAHSRGCEDVVGVGVGMAVPLIRPWLRGNDGGWYDFSICCGGINPDRLGSVSGLLNDKTAVVVPDGGTADLNEAVSGVGTSAVVYGVSGRAYRYAKFASDVQREREFLDTGIVDELWSVSSDVFTWSCTQRGASRNPVADCGNGTQQYTRAFAKIEPTPNPAAYAITLPVNYSARTVDSRGRPLSTPYKRATGHWTLRMQAQYTGWTWTVEWSVGGIGVGRVAGSSFKTATHVVLTDGPLS
jgi:hypothetical protein